jgi:transcriptional/translational regulatory protein YebC/TACO1
MTRVTYDRNKKKYDMARTKQGARLMHEIGLCIKQGGYVEFEQRFDGYEEVADATLHWEAEQ